jgi:hypothetical protein
VREADAGDVADVPVGEHVVAMAKPSSLAEALAALGSVASERAWLWYC